MPPLPASHQSLSAAPLAWGLCGAALLALILPGGQWSDMLALLASTAALLAGYERRDRDMVVAAGLAAGLAPAGLLLTPLAIGLVIGRHGMRHLPLGALVALITWTALPWTVIHPALPNLALLAAAVPRVSALVATAGAGAAAWLTARATITSRAGVFGEARLCALILAVVVPLPMGAIGFVLMLAAMPVPATPRRRAANDNPALRRILRLAA